MNESGENESRSLSPCPNKSPDIIIYDKLVTCAAESVSQSISLSPSIWEFDNVKRGVLCTVHTTYGGLMETTPQDGNGNEKKSESFLIVCDE